MQYCRNDSNFLNYQRHCYNQPTRIKYSKLQLQLETIVKLNLVHFLAFGWEIYYLWASCVCLCGRVWWQVGRYCRLDEARDFCQTQSRLFYKMSDFTAHVLQMSRSTQHMIMMFPHEVYWCQIYRETRPLQCLLCTAFWRVISVAAPCLSPGPRLPGLCAISPRHPGHWTLTQPLHSAWLAHLIPHQAARAGSQQLWCRGCKVNQNYVNHELIKFRRFRLRFPFQSPDKYFSVFYLWVFFSTLIFESRMTWLDETQIQF